MTIEQVIKRLKILKIEHYIKRSQIYTEALEKAIKELENQEKSMESEE